MLNAFRSLADALPEAMLLVDSNATIEDCNLPAEQLFARTRRTLVGEPLSVLFEDDKERVSRWFGMCAASTGMIPTRLSLGTGTTRVVLAEGACLEGSAVTRHVVVRVRREGTLLHRFADLNRRLDALGEEVVRRTHTEHTLLVTQLRLWEANAELAKLAEHDALTGIANRRGFDRTLSFAIDDACRSGLGLALVLFDIDHFKRLNDSSGHLVGDRCLVEVAGILGKAFRRADDVARIGGEEFAAVVCGLSLEEAKHVATRALAAVRDARLSHPDSPNGDVVTMSAGVAYVVGQETINASRLVQLADEALYEAKAKGRDRLCMRACV